MFTYLITSKLIYQLIDWKHLHSTMKLFVKMVSNVNLKALTILAKRLILYTLKGPEYFSTGGCKTVPKS